MSFGEEACYLTSVLPQSEARKQPPAALHRSTIAVPASAAWRSAKTESIETNHSFYPESEAGLSRNSWGTNMRACKINLPLLQRDVSAVAVPNWTAAAIPSLGRAAQTGSNTGLLATGNTRVCSKCTAGKKGPNLIVLHLPFPNIEHCLLKSSYSSVSTCKPFEKRWLRQMCPDALLARRVCCRLCVDRLVWLWRCW